MRTECGAQHHFVGHCRFHRATFIDDILVSTVGDYRPVSGSGKRDEIGVGRFYETMVFRTDGDWTLEQQNDEAWQHPNVLDYTELTTQPAQTSLEATVYHEHMVLDVEKGRFSK